MSVGDRSSKSVPGSKSRLPLLKIRKVPPLLPLTKAPTLPVCGPVAVPPSTTPTTVSAPPLGSLSAEVGFPSNTLGPAITEFSNVVKESSTAVGPTFVTEIVNDFIVERPAVSVTKTTIVCEVASSKLISSSLSTVTIPSSGSILKRPPALSSREYTRGPAPETLVESASMPTRSSSSASSDTVPPSAPSPSVISVGGSPSRASISTKVSGRKPPVKL